MYTNLGSPVNFLDKTASLTPQAYEIICKAATEHPFSGDQSIIQHGTHLCRRCGLALFRANSQFSSGCGWPSFDDTVLNTVEERLDIDGHRIEIRCNRCKAHLGHVFTGEQFTIKNKRYCVNMLSLDFVKDSTVIDTEEIIVAGGCFWGVEYYLQKMPGVLFTEVGYIGGKISYPTYTAVCNGQTEHYEAVRVLFNPEKIDLFALIKHFFEIHDPTQRHGQGPDIGHQYQSAVFCYNNLQVQIIMQAIEKLQDKGYDVATRILPMQTFWRAEADHQHYYVNQKKLPYCHSPVKRFENKPEHP